MIRDWHGALPGPEIVLLMFLLPGPGPRPGSARHNFKLRRELDAAHRRHESPARLRARAIDTLEVTINLNLKPAGVKLFTPAAAAAIVIMILRRVLPPQCPGNITILLDVRH